MNTKWHRETIEALGMHANKSSILNKLNAAYAHSDDMKLRSLVEPIIEEISSLQSNTKSIAPKDMIIGVPSAQKTLEYCHAMAYKQK